MNCTFAKSTGRKAARIAIMATLSATGAALGAVRTAVLVRDVPTPIDGWYELGAAGYSEALASFNNECAAGIGYIDWAALADGGLPANAHVRFVGGIALDSLPAGYTFDFTTVRNVMLLNASLIGAFDIPANASVAVLAVSKVAKASETQGATVTFTHAPGNVTVNAPVRNDGYVAVGKNNNNLALSGGLVGTGVLNVFGVYRSATIGGASALDFGGTLSATEQEQAITIAAQGRESHVNQVSLKANSSVNYAATQLVFAPARGDDEPCTLVITNGVFGRNNTPTFSFSAAQPRIGAQICVCNRNTIRVLKLNKEGDSGCFGLVANTSARYAKGNPPAFDKGFGNVIIGDPGLSSRYDLSPVFNVSPQLNLTLTGSLVYGKANTITVNYRTESNVVNRAALDVSNLYKPTGSSAQWVDNFNINGYAPYNLPRTITVKDINAAKTNTKVHVSDTAWTMPFDFSAAADEVNPNRCETNCSIDIPASGTVTVTNATPAGAASFPETPTEYPVLTCASGGATAFAGWTVEFAGNWAGAKVAPVVKDTGLYVSVKKEGGTVMVFR